MPQVGFRQQGEYDAVQNSPSFFVVGLWECTSDVKRVQVYTRMARIVINLALLGIAEKFTNCLYLFPAKFFLPGSNAKSQFFCADLTLLRIFVHVSVSLF